MISFSNSIDIERDRDAVFVYLADPTHTPEWNWAIDESVPVTPNASGVGSRYRLRRTVPRAGYEVVEITALSPGRRVELTGRLGPFSARLRYELGDTAVGTSLANVVELDPPVPLGPLGDVLAGRVRASVADNLRVLKSVLEQRTLAAGA